MGTKKIDEIEVTPEIVFAHKLAGNDGKIRLRALKKLRQWITRKSNLPKGFLRSDFMKLWKGLFYCMWMQDKPLLQEDLADSLCDLIHCINSETQAIKFMRTFYHTMSREWFGIDQWRVDKYLMMMRRFLRASLQWVRQRQWQEDVIRRFLWVIEEEIYNLDKTSIPPSLQLHMATIYVDELCRVVGEELNGSKLTQFLQPFCKVMTVTKDPALLRDITANVFEHIIRLSDLGREEAVEEARSKIMMEEESDEEDEKIDLSGKKLVRKKMLEAMAVPEAQFDFDGIAELLFEHAKEKSCIQSNRVTMYRLVKKFQKASEGIFPLDHVPYIKMKSVTDEDVDSAARKLTEARRVMLKLHDVKYEDEEFDPLDEMDKDTDVEPEDEEDEARYKSLVGKSSAKYQKGHHVTKKRKEQKIRARKSAAKVKRITVREANKGVKRKGKALGKKGKKQKR